MAEDWEGGGRERTVELCEDFKLNCGREKKNYSPADKMQYADCQQCAPSKRLGFFQYAINSPC